MNPLVESYSADHVEDLPQSPRNGVREIGRGAEPEPEAEGSRHQTRQRDGPQDIFDQARPAIHGGPHFAAGLVRIALPVRPGA